MVTVLVVVAGIVLREQGPPLDGGHQLWESDSRLLSDASVVVAVGAHHTVVQSGAGQPVLLDRRDGATHRLPGARVLGLADDGATVSETDGVLYGADAAGRRTWQEKAGSLVPGNLVIVSSNEEVAAIGGCTSDRGVTVGVRIADGGVAWRVVGPCPPPQAETGLPGAQHQSFYATRPLAGGRIEVSAYELATGHRRNLLRSVRSAHLVGDVLLVLDEDDQLSARSGGKVRWLLDPETAALADQPATGLESAYAGTPAVAFGEGTRALVDAGSGTLRRAEGWGRGPVVRGSGGGTVANGREYLWKGDTLVARNVFTGREVWRADLPAGTATARVEDPGLVTVTMVRDNGRHQVFAFDAATGRQALRTLASVKEWTLLPTGHDTLLATSGDRHYLLDVSG